MNRVPFGMPRACRRSDVKAWRTGSVISAVNEATVFSGPSDRALAL